MYAYIDEAELPKQLATPDVKEVPKLLVEAANAGGGHDNITAVVIRVGEAATHDVTPRNADVSLKLEVLKGMQMFRYLSYKELVQIGAIAEIVDVKPDATIFAAGQPGDAMYVVLAGRVQLVNGGDVVAELGRGQHFGEMSLVDRSVRSLSAVATGTEADAARRDHAQGLLRHHQARAGERREDAVGIRPGARAAPAQDHPRSLGRAARRQARRRHRTREPVSGLMRCALVMLAACAASPPHAVIVISANAEWQAVTKHVPLQIEHSPYGDFAIHTLGGESVVLLHGGYGKISAAGSAQYAIDRWHPRVLDQPRHRRRLRE